MKQNALFDTMSFPPLTLLATDVSSNVTFPAFKKVK